MRLPLIVAFLLMAALARAQTLPNARLTPGAVDSSLTKAKLCDPTFHTGTVRGVKHSDHVAVFKEYGIDCAKVDCGKDFEVDHLISLEIGGSNDIKNLWPQPYKPIGAHQKDVVENWLHKQVCAGAISLPDAQHQISTNWYAVYKQMGAAKQKEALKSR